MTQSLFDFWMDDHISVDEMDIQTCNEIYDMHMPVLVWGTGIHGFLVSEILEKTAYQFLDMSLVINTLDKINFIEDILFIMYIKLIRYLMSVVLC